MILDFILITLTTLVGQVFDNSSGEGIPNVSVYVPGTQTGTATNEDGYFLLRLDIHRKTTIAVSSIGYYTHRFHIMPGQDAGIDIGLVEKNTQLADILVRPGDNPALPIIQRVREARARNNLPPPDQPDLASQIMLSNIQARHLQRHLWKNLQEGMLMAEDSTWLMPLYTYQRTNGQEHANNLILAQTDYSVLLSDLDRPIDFYRNTIPVYSTSFLSPLAADGNNFYTYYLVDSTLYHAPDSSQARKHYTIRFHTRNPYYNTFEGTLVIDSASAALMSVEADVPREVNANYLHEMHIRQTFDNLQHTLQSEQVSLLLDFAIKTDTTHIFPTVLVQHQKTYHLQPATCHLQPATCNLQPATCDSVMQLAQDLPIVRTAKFFAYVIQNATVPTGTKIEIGNASEILHINPQETVRLGLPLRTSPSLWKNVCLEAYAAYGFGDRAWKGRGTIFWNLPTLRRNMLQLRYADEYIHSEISDFDRLIRENAVWSPQMGITTALMKDLYHSDNTYNAMVRQREGRIQLESDWTDHLETQLRLSIGRLGYGEPTHNYAAQPSFFYSSFSAVFRLSWQENKVDLFCRRHYVYNHLPVLYLGGEIGSYRLDNRDQYDMYGKLQIMMRHAQPLGAGGELDYMVQAGVILGAVPYPLLNVFDGNQSYAYDPYRFTLMHNYQYAADAYMLMHVDWNGQGCLLNLIPGIRVLRLRELAEFKMAVGALSNRHSQRLALPEGHLSNLTTPYIELGIGLGNIFRIADLMSVWRLTHRDDPGAPVWSMRFRFHIDS